MPKLRAPALRRPALQTPQLRRASRGGATVTGLEIGATQVIAAQAHVADGRVVADRVVVRSLPAGLVRDGLVVDGDALALELKALFAEHRLPGRVRVGLATPRTVLRVIDMPPLDDADLRIALPIQAQERIPMPLARAVLDHQVVGLVDTPEGQRLRVIAVATEREGVEKLAATLVQAGLRVEGVDLSAFAAIRAVSGGEPAPGPVLYAQLGDLVNLAITEAGVCHFTRQAPQGLAVVLERLMELRHIPADEALTLLTEAATEDPTAGERGDVSEVGAVLARVAGELGSELRAAAEFYGTQSGVTISEGIVTGPLAALRGFVPALADASGLALRCGEAGVAAEGALGSVDARVAPVAVGLAVERIA